MGVKYILNLSRVKYTGYYVFTKDVQDRFSYGILNVFVL